MKLTLNKDKYQDFPEEHLVESLGLLPYWVREYNVFGYTDGEDIAAFMEKKYGYPLYQFNGKILEDGTYQNEYDDDPDLDWIGKMNTPQGMTYFYPYGIIAMPSEDGYTISRMD